MVTNCIMRSEALRTASARHILPTIHPLEQLIGGYLAQGSTSEGIVGLQVRRSLDDYFFTHRQGSGTKDAGQVLWRFSKRIHPGRDPNIFMVDQLWMWILDESKSLYLHFLFWIKC